MKFYLFSVFSVITGTFFFNNTAAADSPWCRTFAIHSGAKRSSESRTSTPIEGELVNKESIIKSISERKSHEHFDVIFAKWESRHPALTNQERTHFLQCIDFYTRQDTDEDGIPDWSGIMDSNPASVLFPLDEDIDGDGVANLLDSDPFDALIKEEPKPKIIPRHLKIQDPKTARLQSALYREFGILALNHTDEHSPLILENLLFLLRNGIPAPLRHHLQNIKTIYAFAGHDESHDLAAFHPQAKSISIGGILSYRNHPRGIQIDILATLAHEIGHAFLFGQVSPSELKHISAAFGGWGSVFKNEESLNLYSPVFFKAHPRIHDNDWRKLGLASSYSAKNIHEWFADTFAASILNKLGRSKHLGKTWKKKRITKNGFNRWLETKLNQKDNTRITSIKNPVE